MDARTNHIRRCYSSEYLLKSLEKTLLVGIDITVLSFSSSKSYFMGKFIVFGKYRIGVDDSETDIFLVGG